MYVSTIFPCQVGVKQGNIFSHCYFKCVSLCDGLCYIIEVAVFLKRHLLLYADDTVILAKTLAIYKCLLTTWLNIVETGNSLKILEKLMTFSRGKIRNKNNFI